MRSLDVWRLGGLVALARGVGARQGNLPNSREAAVLNLQPSKLPMMMTRGRRPRRTSGAALPVLAHLCASRALPLLLPLLLTLAGCAEPKPRLLIINQPMAPVRLIHEGTPGWWLSDALYEATLLKLDALQEGSR